MRCLKKTCPMFGRPDCPAYKECPEYKRTIRIEYDRICQSDLGYSLNLSPQEAVGIYKKIKDLLIVSGIDDFGNIPEYWPSEKDMDEYLINEDIETKYYINKKTGEVYRLYTTTDDCYVWDTVNKKWKEESFDLLQEIILYDNSVELC